MLAPNQRQPSVNVHDFAMNPRSSVPRSAFDISHAKKVPFNFSDLIPILNEEVLPGDTWKCSISVAARTAIPIVPIQDNWHLEFFSYFVPMRLVWPNARKFWGEQDNPADSISFTIPQVTSAAGGFPVASIYDYMGLPTVGQVGGGNTISANALPFCAYNLIYNQCFRDENLQNSIGPSAFSDGPYVASNFAIAQRGKRFDYITQALPWPQKGNTAVSVPLAGTAIVIPNPNITPPVPRFRSTPDTAFRTLRGTAGTTTIAWSGNVQTTGDMQWENSTPGAATNTALVADLTTATSSTINQLRQAFTLQQYLEKDARGGTRYTEFVFNHFGVRSPDARLQRPEFIGGGHANINTTAIPQTSATGLTGGSAPLGQLGATGHVKGGTGFTYSATEHGFILTLVSARADLTYQQGMRRMWSRSTRYDYPVPLLANLGEQTLYNREVYADGSANDANAFGYVPRWDEYRSIPSQVCGIYRSTAAGTIDYWHSAQKFTALPTLNSSFIQDDARTVLQRNFTAGAATIGQQILADFYFSGSVTRALPAYGVPGLTRL